VKVGVGLPAAVPGAGRELILEWARRADAGFFSTLAVIDALRFSNFDPLITLASAAAVTSRIRLATTVLVAPLRNEVVLAGQAATIDAMSGGRLTLGLGVGDREEDFAAAGSSFNDRGRRFDHQLEVMHRVWAGYQPGDTGVGEPYRSGNRSGGERIGPRPIQPGGPEVLIGGYSRAAVERLARWGAGYIGGVARRERVLEIYAIASEVWRAAGRPGRPRFVGAAYFALSPSGHESAVAYLRGYYRFLGAAAKSAVRALCRSPASVEGVLHEAQSAGMDEFIFWPTIPHLDELDRLEELVGRVLGFDR